MLVAIDTVNFYSSELSSTVDLFEWLNDQEHSLKENGELALAYRFDEAPLTIDVDSDSGAAVIKGLVGILVNEGTIFTGVDPDWIDG